MKDNTPVETKVLDFIRRENLLVAGGNVVVGVSGGADSVCLLHILAALREELDVRLRVAHLDHRLRGAASAADARYVAGLARRLGLPATIEARDVRSYAGENHLSLEEAAREVRYAFLAEVAAAAGADRVAVGHTTDDHVETILMHLIRGSGLGGLRGLRPISFLSFTGRELFVVRPLLVLARKTTAAYCGQHHLRPRADASNLSLEPLRNKVRLRLLPELRRYNPRVDAALERISRLAATDLDFIDGEAVKRWGGVARSEGDSLVLDRKKLAALPPALQRRLLRRAVAVVAGGLKDIEAGHIEDVLDALEKPAGKVIRLPGGLSFITERGRYRLAADAASECPFPPLDGETRLNIPGRTSLPGWNIRADILSVDGPESTVEAVTAVDGPGPASDVFASAGGPAPSPGALTACFDLAVTGRHLSVRARRPGDRFQPLGLAGTKKLTDFMIDAGIPRAWRRRVPVVASPGQIVWVVGWRIDGRVRVGGSTAAVLRLTFERA